MNVNLKATKLELTDDLKNYIQVKMDMLEKYLGEVKVINCDFEVGLAVGGQHSGKIYRAEVNLEVPQDLLRVEKTEKDIFKAVDKVKDHLQRSIKRYKEIRMDRKRKSKKIV